LRAVIRNKFIANMIKTEHKVKDKNNKMMKSTLLVFMLILVLFLSLSDSVSAKQQLDHQQLTRKAYLIAFVLKDVKRKSADLFAKNQSFSDGYHYADKMLNKAMAALEQEQLSEANEFLEQAFINMTYVRTFIKKAPDSLDDERRSYVKIAESVDQFISVLSDTLANKEDKLASDSLIKAKSFKELATELQQQNKFIDANLKIKQSYNILVETLSRIKDKETTIVTLNFETPKDEYLYELKQYKSFNMLIELRKADVSLSVVTLKTVASFVVKSTEYFTQAELLVTQLKYEEAIAILETANKNLKRALRVSGVNVY
tara:strand:+ start:24626 stop:25573 length:948 start_codon:yes stop_codon:yes gene_type:complete